MKKSNFVALVLGTVGIIFFALGMCMCLLPEWGMEREGIAAGAAGLAVLLAAAGIWRRMEGKPPIRLNAKAAASAAAGVFGALLLGVGMCMTMLFGKMLLGIFVGAAGIVVLLMLIPLVKGIK